VLSTLALVDEHFKVLANRFSESRSVAEALQNKNIQLMYRSELNQIESTVVKQRLDYLDNASNKLGI
jgi:hypothetical protein